MTRTILSRYDVRPRFLWLLFLVTLFFLPFTLPALAVLLGGVIFISLAVPGLGKTGKVLKPVIPLLLMVLLFTPLFYPEGKPLLALGNWVILTSRGLREVLLLLCRFTGITLLFALFSHATKSDEFLSCLRWYGLPFRAALVINLTLRSVPELLELYRRVKEAHSLRAQEPETAAGAGWIKRILQVVPHLTSVLIITVKRIEPLSMSLELRGAGIRHNRSVLRPLPRGKKLVLDFTGFACLVGVLVFLLVKTPAVWYKSP